MVKEGLDFDKIIAHLDEKINSNSPLDRISRSYYIEQKERAIKAKEAKEKRKEEKIKSIKRYQQETIKYTNPASLTFDEVINRAYQELDDAADTAIVSVETSDGNIIDVTDVKTNSTGRLILVAGNYNRTSSKLKP